MPAEPLDPAVDPALGAELRAAVQRLSRRLRQQRADDALSDSQSSALGFLFREGPRTPAEISAFEHVSPPSMNRTLNALQAAEYITREPDPVDGRKVIVTLTEAGRAVVIETRRRRDEWLEEQLARLTPTEQQIVAAAVPLLRGFTEFTP